MNVEDIYSQLANGPKEGAVRAGWVERYLESPITLWCNLHAPTEARDSMTDQMQHIFDIGNAHQDRVNERMYPGGIQKAFTTEDEGFRLSLKIMSQAGLVIKNMPLVCWSHGLVGRPDILELVTGVPSIFGDYSYRVVEIKSAKKLRESQMLQAALYNRVLGLVQGYEPPVFQMVNGDFEVVSVAMAEVEERLDIVLEEVKEIIDGKPVDFCYGAAGWPWESYVDSQAIVANDVSLIVGVGASVRENLMKSGYTTLQSIAQADENELVSIDRVGPSSAKKMVVSAQAIQSQRPQRRGELDEILKGKTEVFFDFEGAQEQVGFETAFQVNYLIGAVWRLNGNQGQYRPFFADRFDLEGENLSEFMSWAVSLDDPVFYHWHHYERTHLAKMAERWGEDPAKVSFVLDRLVDLSPWVTNGYAFPAYSESLKAIAKSIGFKWQQDDVSGVGSIALYENFVTSGSIDQMSKDKIIIYNRDDCFATMHIYDWVMAQ
ncbi:MAG: TM0106 family RecB-like putative nuclease [Chloroflexota bacterium]|nr:TM0106 family RecB-like putative nuclease [Chloroflexota bacterium]